MSETETGDFLRDSTEPPNVMEIHFSTMPFGNQSIMTVTIPGHVPYRELYKTHPDNTLITAFKLLRRVANDYAALLVKCSTTLEAAETPYLNMDLKAVVAELEIKKLKDQLEEEIVISREKLDAATLRIAELEADLKKANSAMQFYKDELSDAKGDRNKLKRELEEACSEILSQTAQRDVKEKFGDEAGLATHLQDGVLESFGYSLTDEATQREQRRDDLLRSALRVLGDLL